MVSKQIIDRLIAEGEAEQALESLSANIDEAPDDALWPYLRGRLLWSMGRHGSAITDYGHAVALDPSSPAATALEMATSVMDFRHKDLLNP